MSFKERCFSVTVPFRSNDPNGPNSHLHDPYLDGEVHGQCFAQQLCHERRGLG